MSAQKPEIELIDLQSYPVWRYEPETELFEPLTDIECQIGSIDELHFYAKFTTQTGHQFEGSVTGKGNTAIGIFCNGRWYSLNKEWRKASLEQLSALIHDCDLNSIDSPLDVFPIKFQTAIMREPFVDWDGEFSLD